MGGARAIAKGGVLAGTFSTIVTKSASGRREITPTMAKKIPGFTAETSFSRTIGLYQSPGRAIYAAARTGAIYPELRSQEGEVINVGGCSPGYLQLGEGDSMTCIPDPTLPLGGGDYGGGGGLGGGIGGGGGGSGSDSGYHPTEGGKCHAESGSTHLNHGNYTDTKYGWKCCDKTSLCVYCQDDPKRCQDGQTS
jgi:hypothetical protein